MEHLHWKEPFRFPIELDQPLIREHNAPIPILSYQLTSNLSPIKKKPSNKRALRPEPTTHTNFPALFYL